MKPMIILTTQELIHPFLIQIIRECKQSQEVIVRCAKKWKSYIFSYKYFNEGIFKTQNDFKYWLIMYLRKLISFPTVHVPHIFQVIEFFVLTIPKILCHSFSQLCWMFLSTFFWINFSSWLGIIGYDILFWIMPKIFQMGVSGVNKRHYCFFQKSSHKNPMLSILSIIFKKLPFAKI